MAKKKAASKKAAPKAAAKPAAPKPIKEALSKSGLVAHISETSGVAPRDVRAVMSAQRNKTDAVDALGLTHIGAHRLVPSGPISRLKAATGCGFC